MKRSRRARVSLREAIRVAGSQNKLAACLGVRQSAVAGWLVRGLPAERVLAIEAATGVSRHDLRADLYPLLTEPMADREPPPALMTDLE